MLADEVSVLTFVLSTDCSAAACGLRISAALQALASLESDCHQSPSADERGNRKGGCVHVGDAGAASRPHRQPPPKPAAQDGTSAGRTTALPCRRAAINSAPHRRRAPPIAPRARGTAPACALPGFCRSLLSACEHTTSRQVSPNRHQIKRCEDQGDCSGMSFASVISLSIVSTHSRVP